MEKISNRISEFCNLASSSKREYESCFEEVNRLDKLTQDYLHMLELEGLNYKERAKVATKLTLCRKQRRTAKNTVEVLEPMIQFLDSEKGKNMMNLLREVLGRTRKVEEYMENRGYNYKVLKRGEEE